MVSARHFSRIILALCLSLLIFSACNKGQGVDPLAEPIEQYKAAVEPPIQKSEMIANIFVQIVLEDKSNPDPDKAAQRIASDVIPKAKVFVEEVNKIQPKDPTLAEIHQFLLQVATLRMEGYTSIVEGYSQNNLELFNEGHKKITESKIQENTYVDRADAFMGAHGYRLTYFTPDSGGITSP